MSEKTNAKRYLTSTKRIKFNIFGGVGTLCLGLLYLNIISKWQIPGIFYLLTLSISIPILFLSSDPSRYNVIEVDDHGIRFIPIYNKEDYISFEWQYIKVCIAGKLGLSNGLIPYVSKGLEIHYLYGTGVNKSIVSYRYPLGHIADYDGLLEDIQHRCAQYHISFEEIE